MSRRLVPENNRAGKKPLVPALQQIKVASVGAVNAMGRQFDVAEALMACAAGSALKPWHWT
jgi:hypothetical protein